MSPTSPGLRRRAAFQGNLRLSISEPLSGGRRHLAFDLGVLVFGIGVTTFAGRGVAKVDFPTTRQSSFPEPA